MYVDKWLSPYVLAVIYGIMTAIMKRNAKYPVVSFSQTVLRLALSIPAGRVTTYGRLARTAGAGPMAAQSITTILCRAEQSGARGIPWHRIVYSDGRVWLDEKHRKERLALYKKEGIRIDDDGKIVDFRKVLL